jgi:hypothetical protein
VRYRSSKSFGLAKGDPQSLASFSCSSAVSQALFVASKGEEGINSQQHVLFEEDLAESIEEILNKNVILIYRTNNLLGRSSVDNWLVRG